MLLSWFHDLTSGVHLGQVVQGGAGGSSGLDQVSSQQGHSPDVTLFGRMLLWRQMAAALLPPDDLGWFVWSQMFLPSDMAHRVFDRVINDQVVIPKRKPRSHGHKVSVLQGDWTSPCTQDKAWISADKQS